LLGVVVEAFHVDLEAPGTPDIACVTVAAVQRCMDLFQSASGNSNHDADISLEDVVSWAGCAGLPRNALEDPEYSAITTCLVPVAGNDRVACLPLSAAAAVMHIAAVAAHAEVPGACDLLHHCYVSTYHPSSAAATIAHVRKVSALLTISEAEDLEASAAATTSAIGLARCLAMAVAAAPPEDPTLASALVESLPSISTLTTLSAVATASAPSLATADAAAALLIAADARVGAGDEMSLQSVDATLQALNALNAAGAAQRQDGQQQELGAAYLTAVLVWLLVRQLNVLVDVAVRSGDDIGTGGALNAVADSIAKAEVRLWSSKSELVCRHDDVLLETPSGVCLICKY
jgi:hypothetical protein